MRPPCSRLATVKAAMVGAQEPLGMCSLAGDQQQEGGSLERRASLFVVVGSVLLLAFAGVAMAAAITCTGGRCEGTNQSDQITGTDQRDRIFALAGADEVEARAGQDELNGGNGPDDLFGETQNDTYYGGRGEDAMEGEEGTDEHYGGDNNDYIDAVDDDVPAGTRDLVDCGSGVDTAVVREPEDIVSRNCEEVIEVTSAAAVAPPSDTSEEEQRRLREAFLQKLGG